MPDWRNIDVSAALMRHPYAIFLVGSRFENDQNLMTCSWGTQCSYDPKLYTIFIEQDAHTRKLIDGGGVFSVCLVPPDSEEVLSLFTKPAGVVGDKLGGQPIFAGPQTGAPIYDGAVAYFECRVTDARQLGSHIQYTGEVVGGAVGGGERAWTVQELGWEYGG